ncbi:MAG: DUF1996 domain-containing protein [Actinobacteria bacterium]|nr:DUF1996 domain-containing protein [Actinomycetota bacterium]
MSTRFIAIIAAVALASAAGVVFVAQSASAAADPSFSVACYPRGMAQNDPIVFPGQAGKSHMHSFFGAKNVNENTTVGTLLAESSSQCGSQFNTVDLSAYWIPTLYQNGQAKHVETGAYQLHAYYQRAGGAGGALVAQAFPRGLKMIAGDMRATTPQDNVSYVCAKENDTGSQRGGGREFMTCNSDEVFIAKLVFPDCWDGKNLDSADHKSHMAYSSGSNASCPGSHPVKLPRLTFEAWYFGVNGDASSFSWASGGAYTFHGDVISAWDTTAAANLVNQCINVAVDCNPLQYGQIPKGAVTQAQIDAQLTGTTPAAPAPPAPAPSPSASHGGGHTMPMPSPTPTPTPTPDATPTATSAAQSSPFATPSATSMNHETGGHGPATISAPAGSGPIALVSVILAMLAAGGLFPFAVFRRRGRLRRK